MRIFKCCFLTTLVIFCFHQSFSQEPINLSEVDTLLRSQPGYKLKRGIYKNYQEFLDNVPSITRDFKVIQKTKSEKSLIKGICAVGLDVLDGQEKTGQVWGFCDGNAVYYNYSIFENKYWKILYIGPYSYFFHGKQIRTDGELFNAVIDNSWVDLFFLNKKGKPVHANVGYLLRLFSPEPPVREDYKYDPNQEGDHTKIKYLRKFNTLTQAKINQAGGNRQSVIGNYKL